MRNVHRTSMLATLALGALAVTAQAQAKPKTFGIVAGVDFASFNGSDADLAPDFDKHSLTGFAGGFYVTIPVGTSVVIEPEALYVGKGSKYSLTSGTGGSGNLNWNLSYIEIPVLVRYNFQASGGPYFLAGPDVAFNLSCTLSGTGDVETALSELGVSDCVDIGAVLGGAGTDANSVTFGGVLGLGFQRDKFGLEARYEFDFSNAFKEADFQSNVKNAVWEIFLRYQIK